MSEFGTGFVNPYKLAFDPSGNLFITDYGTGVIYKVLEVNSSVEPFSEFTIDKARVNLGDETGQDEFEVEGRFKLVDGGRIDPVNEDVTLTLGAFSEIIQDGFFVDTDEFGVPEGYQYNGPDGSMIRIAISNDGTLKVKARDIDLGEIDFNDPVSFSVQIGNDLGETVISFDDKGELIQP